MSYQVRCVFLKLPHPGSGTFSGKERLCLGVPAGVCLSAAETAQDPVCWSGVVGCVGVWVFFPSFSLVFDFVRSK